VDELFHADFPAQAGLPQACVIRVAHSSFLGTVMGSLNLPTREISMCKQRRTVRMPLNSWWSSCRQGNQTLLGLINMPKSRE